MEIKHVPEDNSGEFELYSEGEKMGFLHYILFGSGRLIIQHTEVARQLKGEGAARKLLDTAIEYAREQGYKVVPICPYAKAVMTKNREQYKDILIG